MSKFRDNIFILIKKTLGLFDFLNFLNLIIFPNYIGINYITYIHGNEEK